MPLFGLIHESPFFHSQVKKVWKSSADTLQLAAGWLKDHLVIGESPRKHRPGAVCSVACSPLAWWDQSLRSFHALKHG